MKLKNIQLKAAFLLFIFSLNMFVGTACALGLDMGFNENHHEHEQNADPVNVHANGEHHHHEEASDKHSDNDKKDDCCNDSVLKLLKADKTLSQVEKLVSPVSNSVFLPSYYSANISNHSQVNTAIKYYVHGHHPPIPNILIAIQRFQI